MKKANNQSHNTLIKYIFDKYLLDNKRKKYISDACQSYQELLTLHLNNS